MTKQPEALRLADSQDCVTDDNCGYCMPCSVAAELRRLSVVEAQRDALLEAIKPMIDLAEFWINHGHKGHMCEQEFKVWLAIGHESDAMRNARAAIKAVEENT